MNKTYTLFSISILLSLLICSSAFSQYVMDQKNSIITINGTSSMHDWTAKTQSISGELKASTETTKPIAFTTAKITLPTTSLKTDKDAMDKNMHKALKADKHPEIVFVLKNHSIQKNETFVKGELTIAGVTKLIETKITHKIADKSLSVSGETFFNMSDFGIKPPEFFMGALKTGDKVDLNFQLVFKNTSILK